MASAHCHQESCLLTHLRAAAAVTSTRASVLDRAGGGQELSLVGTFTCRGTVCGLGVAHTERLSWEQRTPASCSQSHKLARWTQIQKRHPKKQLKSMIGPINTSKWLFLGRAGRSRQNERSAGALPGRTRCPQRIGREGRTSARPWR